MFLLLNMSAGIIMVSKNIFITGGSSGIGYETTALLLEKGYRVFATARKESDLDKLRSLGAFQSIVISQIVRVFSRAFIF